MLNTAALNTLALNSAIDRLAGQGSSASAVSGSLGISVNLAGSVTSVSAASGLASLSNPLAGAISEVTTASATASLSISLNAAGTSTITVSGTAALYMALSASGSVTVSTSAYAYIGKWLQGNATVVTSASALPSLSKILSGGPVYDTMTLTTLNSGALNTQPMNGVTIGSSNYATISVSGQILLAELLSGSVASFSSVSAAILNDIIALGGQVTEVTTAYGTPIITVTLAGVPVSSLAEVSALLALAENLTGSVITTTSVPAQALTLSMLMAGNTSVTTINQGTMSLAMAMAGGVSTSTLTSGLIRLAEALSGLVSTQTTVPAAALNKVDVLAGALQTATDAWGTAALALNLAGSVTELSTIPSALLRVRPGLGLEVLITVDGTTISAVIPDGLVLNADYAQMLASAVPESIDVTKAA